MEDYDSVANFDVYFYAAAKKCEAGAPVCIVLESNVCEHQEEHGGCLVTPCKP